MTPDYYGRILEWILKHKEQKPQVPLFVGVSGAQGSGKSTMCRWLSEGLKREGLSNQVLSIDDFYLTRDEQQALGDQSTNPYLQQRGYPGTHDVELMVHTLRRLHEGHSVRIPRYDKSAFQGRGDRRPETQWSVVDGPLDVVLFEGWFLGFRPTEKSLPDDLATINKRLRDYQSLNDLYDLFVLLRPQDYEFIVNWRLQAEQNMREQKGSGMTDEQTINYIRLFLPAYETYLSDLNIKNFGVFAAIEVLLSESRESVAK